MDSGLAASRRPGMTWLFSYRPFILHCNAGIEIDPPYFGTDPRFWLNLQAAHDLSKTERLHSYKKVVPRTAA